MKRMLILLALLATTTASAAWYPRPERSHVRLKVGEERLLTVWPVWTGIWVLPWHDWTFDTGNRRVAIAEGVVKAPQPTDAKLTGIAPGATYLRVLPFDARYTYIEVLCGEEDPIRPAAAFVTGAIGRAVTLAAVTPIAHRTTFTWYRGRVGDQSSPLPASGPEIELTPQSVTEYVWVLATTPCSTSTAEFLVTAHPSKKRSLRR